MGRFHRAIFAGVLLLAAIGTGISDNLPNADFISVSVDPRVELMSIIFRLAGNQEYGKCKIPSYNADIDAWFSPFRNHPVVDYARNLSLKRNIRFDAPITLAIHLTEGFDLQERLPLSPLPDGIDDRWTCESLREFLALARQFSRVSDFHCFFGKHLPLFEETAKKAEKIINRKAPGEWFSRFFRAPPVARFCVILGMNNGGLCFGPHFKDGAKNESYCILGVSKVDSTGKPSFEEFPLLSAVIHEFGHTFVHPVVQAHLSDLESSCSGIFRLFQSTLAKHACGEWESMVEETLVRAAAARFVRETGGEQPAREEIRRNACQGFFWIGKFADRFHSFESDRMRYPDLGSFMPEIVRLFREVHDEAADEARKPHIEVMSPANGSRQVDPSTEEIRVTFDRPMKSTYSWCARADFPEARGRPFWTLDRKSCVLRVKLKPGTKYRLSLNTKKSQGFVSEDGIPLAPTLYTFSTGSSKSGH